MDAAQARELAYLNREWYFNYWFKNTLQKIEQAARRGFYAVKVKKLDARVVDELVRLGYDVRYDAYECFEAFGEPERNQRMYTKVLICWEPV
jgi:hypothetical protein